MRLYGYPPTRSTRVLWTLRELEVAFDFVTVDPTKGELRSPAYLAVNPVGKLPALADGDLVLTESVAICVYLAEKYPEKGLMPSGLRARAETNRWLLFAATELEQPVWRIARHTVLYPPEQRIAAEVPIAGREFRDMAAVLEGHLDGREFIVGDALTVADIVTAYTIDMATAQQNLGLLDGLPRTTAFLERMYRRPLAPPRIHEAFAALHR